MEYLLLKGKQQINGTIQINGAKNAAVAILPAALLTRGTVEVDNLPKITDIDKIIQILQSLGAVVTSTGKRSVSIDSSRVNSFCRPHRLLISFVLPTISWVHCWAVLAR